MGKRGGRCMSKEEILKRAISKAVKNGYDFPFVGKVFELSQLVYGNAWIYQVIFSHDFCKAFWGEEKIAVDIGGSQSEVVPIWREYLKKMVLEKDKLKYLEKFI